MKLPTIFELADLRRIFSESGAPDRVEGDRMTVVKAHHSAPVNGEKRGDTAVVPALRARPLACAGCGNPKGTLVRRGEGVYTHKHCEAK